MQIKEKIIAVAPMMNCTDRHFRYFLRGFTGRAVLYTEMVTADAVIHGDRDTLLGHDGVEQPLALQLGGSDPGRLAEAAKIGAGYGYREVNLNVGCPSGRVRSGSFGACLMRQPARVASCVAAMKQAVDKPVTVKCRLGVDDQDPEAALDEFAGHVFEAGADALWVHARKAWLDGLSPKENRHVPPLDYDRVYRLKQRFADRFIGINGGIADLDDATAHLAATDGVMIGRAAYARPETLADIDRRFYASPTPPADAFAAAQRMISYAARHCREGGRLSSVTRHMTGLFHGAPGARLWRRTLTTAAARRDAGAEVIETALAAVSREARSPETGESRAA